MYTYLRTDSVEFGLTRDAIMKDNVGAIRRLFQERWCSPKDQLLWDNAYHEESLLSVSELEPSRVELAMTCDPQVLAAAC